MNLAIDIGNTRMKLGVFTASGMVERRVFGNLDTGKALTWLRQFRIDDAIISDVRGHDELINRIQVGGTVHVLDHASNLPIRVSYETPETLGRDRIAAACGAHSEFPDTDLLVVDCGTCVTCDVVTADGEYIGGNIAPGWEMRLRAMHHFTGQLPSVKKRLTGGLLGKTTEEAMQNGAYVGVCLEIDGLAAVLREQFEALKVLITGGDAADLAEYVKTEIFARPDLVLTGLNEILQLNVNVD